MARRSADIHGILVVDKPGLPANTPTTPKTEQDLLTSHDVVQRVRRMTGQKRIGHTGTLDPMASGVLVLCLGHATRLVEYYQGHDKQYLAEVILGAATDTYDAMGTLSESAPIPALERETIEQALDCFRGAILQTPPIYSALKQDGESLHKKARRGETVVVKARPIVVHQLDLVHWNGCDRLKLRVHCSAGTYIRSLANDLGRALGTVGHLGALRREAAGSFTEEDAHSIAMIEQRVAGGTLATVLLPPGAGLDLPALMLSAEEARRIGFGQQVSVRRHAVSARDKNRGDQSSALFMACDENRRFLGIVRRLDTETDGSEIWKAEKWLTSG